MIDLLGVPFRYGGRGPDAYDCYGLLKACYARRGVTLPDYHSPDDLNVIAAMMSGQLELWHEVTRQPKVAVLFRLGRLAAHVGYALDDYRFIHTWEKSGGVLIERLDTWQHRIVGYYDYQGL